MNKQDLELKIAGLEKAIKEHKDFSATYESDLKSTQKQLEDYNKPELTPNQTHVTTLTSRHSLSRSP